jgi:nicotinate-nucleotide adenylyltransferase
MMTGTGHALRRERLGILGGSFNPVHNGHLLLAQTALEVFDLNRVLFMPCAIQPHKPPAMLAPAAHRAAMIEAAILDNLSFDLLDIELRRGGVSYSVDSLREIRTLHPHADLFFLIGADTLGDLHGWKDIYTVLDMCTFAVFARPGYDAKTLRPDLLGLAPPWPERLLQNVCTMRQIDISASDIRHRVAEGLSIRYLVPQAVEMILMEHHLYC